MIALRRALTWLVISQVALLGVTGAFLVFGYRPTAAQAWGGLVSEDAGWSLALAVRTAHRWLAWTSVLVAMVLAAVSFSESMIRWRGPLRRRSGAITGPTIVILIVIAVLTGFALPWDQLALKAVTVGSNIRGYRWVFGNDVQFVLVGGAEVDVATIRAVFVAHVIVVPALLAVALGIAARRDRGDG